MSQWRGGLRDEQWERIRHLLPGRAGSNGRPARNNRLFVDAILYRLRVAAHGAICQLISATSAWTQALDAVGAARHLARGV